MLSDQALNEILHAWSFWDAPPSPGIQREITLPTDLHTDLALLIQGVRRCGKSTLLTQLPAHYQLPLTQCYYCNFEDPKLLNDLNHTLLSHIVSLARKTHPPEYPCYFFFDEIQHVAKMTFDSCGSQLSYQKIAAVTGLTVDTVKSYLEACEQAYLLFACPYFSFSEKKRLIKRKKYYPIDPGLRHAVVPPSERDKGKHLELLVFLRLIQTHEQVYYWEETHQGGVDFVTLQGSTPTPYQVSWEGPQPRHEKALQHFYDAFPQAGESIFITKENAEGFLN